MRRTCLAAVLADQSRNAEIEQLHAEPFGHNHVTGLHIGVNHKLAVRIFEMTSEGMWEQAALPSLGIVLAGLLPVMLLIRQTEK